MLASAAFLTGCESKDPNPELKDPIYQDIVNILAELNEGLEGSKTFLDMGEEEARSLSPGDPQLVNIRKDIRKEKIKIKAYEQKIRYYTIRLERRKLESRIAYEESFRTKVAYPNMEEFEAYKAHKKLRSASSNWNDRVPRLKERIDAYIRKMNGEEEPEKKKPDEDG